MKFKFSNILAGLVCFGLLFLCACDKDDPDSDVIEDPDEMNSSTALLALGNKFLILQSADNGLTWERADVPASVKTQGTSATDIFDAVYANSKWIAVGGIGKSAVHRGIILSSMDDGKTWAEVDNPSTSGLMAVAYSDGKYIASGTQANVLTSDDGVTWEKNDLTSIIVGAGNNTQAAIELKHIAIGSGSIVIGGVMITRLSGLTDRSDVVVESTDKGETWKSIPNTNGSGIYGLVYGNEEFIATSSGGILTKTGGTWVIDNRSGKTKVSEHLSFINDHFAASFIYNSASVTGIKQGNTWNESTIGDFNLDINSIIYGKDKYLLLGQRGLLGSNRAVMYTSGDCLNWTASNDWIPDELTKADTKLRTGIFSDGKFIVASNKDFTTDPPSLIFTSENGQEWPESTIPTLEANENISKIISGR